MKDIRKTKKQLIDEVEVLRKQLAELKISGSKTNQKGSRLYQDDRLYRLLADNVSDVIWTTDINLRITYTSPSIMNLTGYWVDEIIGHGVDKILTEESLSTALKALEDALSLEYNRKKDASSSRVLKLKMIHKNGSTISAEVLVTFLRNSDDSPVGIIGVTRDITKRIQIEEEKKQLESKLYRAEKMEAISILAGGVAHDLNNVLSGIISYPKLLLMDMAEDDPLREDITIIQQSGQKAAAIVQDMLILSRRGIHITDVVNLNSIINTYLLSPEHAKLIEYHPNVHFEVDIEPDLFNILGSPTHISKIVMNLASNAAEALPNGGIVVLSTRHQYIDIPLKGYENVEKGDYVLFQVSDNGVGISDSDLERIFEPFYTKKVMGRSGTGLGVAVVWAIVKDHKGYIDIQSQVGEGTTFYIYFPITKEESINDESDTSNKDEVESGTILVVDDVSEQRKIVCKMLSRLGYSVASVSKGEDAIEYIREMPVDLLFLDMIMDPGIDGLDTYKKILKLYPKQKAIITSGYYKTDRVKEAEKLGAGVFIGKPFIIEKIRAAIRRELKK
ncbi:MAG: response regulator [Spirochaetota bacterium]|nr:response regulator [Spirochaetota bacterium]